MKQQLVTKKAKPSLEEEGARPLLFGFSIWILQGKEEDEGSWSLILCSWFAGLLEEGEGKVKGSRLDQRDGLGK